MGLGGPEEPLEVVRGEEAVDWRGRVCASGREVLACLSGEDGGTPHLIGMAAHEGTIAVAEVFAGNPWLTQGVASHADRVRVGWYDSELRRIRQTVFSVEGAATDVEMAFVPGGWVVAVQVPGKVELIWLDAAGVPAGPRTVLRGASWPGLAVGREGEVLVVHVEGREGGAPVMATLVEPRGAARRPVKVFEGSIEPNFGAQVAADNGGFLVARRTNEGVAVARVERSGVVGQRHALSLTTEYPSLAWCGGEGRLVWSDFSANGHIRGATIDPAGKRGLKEHVLGAIPEYFNPSPVLCDGAGALALLGGYTGGTGRSRSLDLTRVDRESGAQRGAIPVLAPEGVDAYDPRMIRLDARRVAVGWIAMARGERGSQVGLAIVEAPLARSPAERGSLKRAE